MGEIEDLKQRLELERGELSDEINRELTRDADSRYDNIVNAVRDRGEESVADLYADLNLAMTEKHVERLKAVENALARLREDVYGVCLDCGGKIDDKRLQADPAVARCLKCQEQVESVPSAGDVTPSL